MKSFSILVLPIILLLCCAPNETGQEPFVPRSADDVREDFKNLDLDAGINDITLESAVENVFWNFRVIIPEGIDSNSNVPLIMRLHGGARNSSADAHKSTNCLVGPAFENTDAIIISPNSNGELWYDQNNQVQVLALIDLATTYLPIDANKVVIMGYSDGGNGSFFFAQYYTSLFAAAIPMATSYNPVNSNGIVEKIDIPIYAIHGSNDQLFPIEVTQGYINQLIDAGTDITFSVAPGLDHYSVCDYLSYLNNAVDWLETTIW